MKEEEIFTPKLNNLSNRNGVALRLNKPPRSPRLLNSGPSSPSELMMKAGKFDTLEYNELKKLVHPLYRKKTPTISKRDISHIKDTKKEVLFRKVEMLPISLVHLKKYLQVSDSVSDLNCKFETANCPKEKCLDTVIGELEKELPKRVTSVSPKAHRLPSPIQKFMNEVNYNKTPTSRQDILNLVEWFQYMKHTYVLGFLDKLYLSGLDFEEKQEKLEAVNDILSVGLKELTRQISGSCGERGEILNEILNLLREYHQLKSEIEQKDMKGRVESFQKKYEISNRERKEVYVDLSQKNKILKEELKLLQTDISEKHKLIVDLKRTVNKVKYELSIQNESQYLHETVNENKKGVRRNTTIESAISTVRTMKETPEVNLLVKQADSVIESRFSKDKSFQANIPIDSQSKLTNTRLVFYRESEEQTEDLNFPELEEDEEDEIDLEYLLEPPSHYEIQVVEELNEPILQPLTEGISSVLPEKILDNEEEGTKFIYSDTEALNSNFYPALTVQSGSFSLESPSENLIIEKLATQITFRLKGSKRIKFVEKEMQTDPDMRFETEEQEIYSAFLSEKQDLLENLTFQLQEKQGKLRRILEQLNKKKSLLKEITYSISNATSINSDDLLLTMKANGAVSQEAENEVWKAGFTIGYSKGKAEAILEQEPSTKEQEKPIKISKRKTVIGQFTVNNKLVRLASSKNHPALKFLLTFLQKKDFKIHATLTTKMLFKIIYSIYSAASKVYSKKKEVIGLLEFTYDEFIQKHQTKPTAEKKLKQIVASAIQMASLSRSSLFLRLLGLDKYLELPSILHPFQSWQLLLFLYDFLSISKTGLVISYHETEQVYWIPKLRAIEAIKKVGPYFFPFPVTSKIISKVEESSRPDFLKVNSQGIVSQDLVFEIAINEYESLNQQEEMKRDINEDLKYIY